MRAVVIIPARYKSSRFPGKPLIELAGRPMILWVAELSSRAVGKENVYIATDDSRITDVVVSAGYNAIMTSENAKTGTDRLAEAAQQIEADIYINVQGDEPVIRPEDILKVLDRKLNNPDVVVNAYCWVSPDEDPESVNIPKVITTEDDRLVYMSRRALPGFKDAACAPKKYKKQVCIYGFNREELLAFSRFGRKSELEACEDIEILRFLDLKKPIIMVESSSGSLAVDVPEDVGPVEAAIKRLHGL